MAGRRNSSPEGAHIELELQPGRQRVEFIGVRYDLSLPTVSREVHVGADTAAPRGQNYAFLIGIQQYDKWRRLETPVADVGEVGPILRERYDFVTALPSFGDLVLRRYSVDSITPLLDGSS